MIIKSHGRRSKSWRQLLEYMQRGADEQSIQLVHNLRGSSIPEWVKEYRSAEEQRIHRRRGMTILSHDILSFSPQDAEKLTIEKLEDLTREYIEQRALRGLVVAISHQDREHTHVHLAISGVDLAGKSMRMSKAQFNAIKVRVQDYEKSKFPELEHSIVQHGKRSRQRHNKREQALRHRTGGPSKRDLVSEQLQQMFRRSGSLARFKDLLAQQGMELYLRNGRPQGVLADRVRYRLSTLGITKEELAAVERAPDRSQQLALMRQQAREVDREEPSLERTRERSRKALRGPQHIEE